jgi:uncharacterized membrane protein YesL
MRVFRIIGKSAVAFYDELFFYMLFGLINLLCWILIIPGPVALAGVYTISQRAVRSKGVTWPLIWDGIKEYGLRSLLLFLISLVVYGVIGINLWFYLNAEVSPFPASVAVWTTPIFIFFGVIWTGVVFYAQSLLMELENPKMTLVLRNSLFLTLLRPLQTLGLLVVALASLALSIVLPVLLIVWPGFVSCLALTAARTMITELTESAKATEEEEEAEEGDEEAEDVDDDATR